MIFKQAEEENRLKKDRVLIYQRTEPTKPAPLVPQETVIPLTQFISTEGLTYTPLPSANAQIIKNLRINK